jgi:hypothetical protein
VKPEQKRLFVIDGSKALRTAINAVFGSHQPVQRCRAHKLRNVVDHLPKDQKDQVKSVLRAAWKMEAKAGMARLRKLAEWLEREYPSAAASLLEGLEYPATLFPVSTPETIPFLKYSGPATPTSSTKPTGTPNPRPLHDYDDEEHPALDTKLDEYEEEEDEEEVELTLPLGGQPAVESPAESFPTLLPADDLLNLLGPSAPDRFDPEPGPSFVDGVVFNIPSPAQEVTITSFTRG